MSIFCTNFNIIRMIGFILCGSFGPRASAPRRNSPSSTTLFFFLTLLYCVGSGIKSLGPLQSSSLSEPFEGTATGTHRWSKLNLYCAAASMQFRTVKRLTFSQNNMKLGQSFVKTMPHVFKYFGSTSKTSVLHGFSSLQSQISLDFLKTLRQGRTCQCLSVSKGKQCRDLFSSSDSMKAYINQRRLLN